MTKRFCFWSRTYLEHFQTMVSSHKKYNSVVNHSLSCRSKPSRPSFIFRTQIRIFFL